MNAECREIRPLLSAYMDNDLRPEELRAMQEHVATCAECAATLREYRQLRTSVRALPQPTPPPALREAVFARATPAYRRRATIVALGQRGLSYAALAAATIALFLTAALLLRTGAGPSVGSPDTTPPRITQIAPGDGTVDWALETRVRITFSEPMDRDSITNALIISADPPLSAEERGRLIRTIRWEGNTLSVGDGTLQPDTVYSFAIDPQLARDLAGNALELGNEQITFRTIEPVLPTATAIVAAAAPSPMIATPTPTVPAVTPTATTRPTETAPPSSSGAALATPPPTPTLAAPFVPSPTLAPMRTPTQAAPLPTATPQPAQPTATPTEAPPAPTATQPPPTSTPIPSPTPQPTATSTPPPPSPTATTPKLPYAIAPDFAALYAGNAAVVARIGLPTAGGASVPATYLAFERGWMLWRGDTRTIYVLFNEDPLVWYAFADGWVEGMEPVGGPANQPGLFKPMRGFGKVWAENADVQRRLGFAVSETEVGGTMVVQPFERGLLIASDLDTPVIYAFYQNNLVERFKR